MFIFILRLVQLDPNQTLLKILWTSESETIKDATQIQKHLLENSLYF